CHAQNVERPVDDRGDIVTHHLAAGLRVRVSQQTLHGLSAGSPDRPTDPAVLAGLRDAWLRLATNEYVAVAALDAQRVGQAYDERLRSLHTAIAEGAEDAMCGGG